jgi:hypothetical protein
MPLVGRGVASEDMLIAVIGANFEERIIWPVPQVEYFLNHVIDFAKLEADRSLIFLSAGVTFHTQFHLPSPIIVSDRPIR